MIVNEETFKKAVLWFNSESEADAVLMIASGVLTSEQLIRMYIAEEAK